ncbi:MAG: DUF4238 domain-containing protein [Leptolyngbyaceae cyanobacterium CSU_1_4]|nr:DUF4238 domain-containing protein [Leptolyngbyaceae cyanobacterium CSU_1_4]
MTIQITKKQHYVPQFLLRNFSNDRKTINIFNISDNSFEGTSKNCLWDLSMRS